MSASNRASLISKLHSSLKKHYEVPPAEPARPLLEHVLYASLLEDSPSDLADEALAKCEQEFFDWNEVRVTTITELTQVFSRLPDPGKAAQRLKGNLQAIFEEFYTFDLDHLKKENLGKAVSKFEKMPGMTPFVLSYTVQHGLGGHSIPVDYSAMVVMLVLGIASQSEASSGRVPGLERAIPKSKGIEFSALLHQAAVALNQNAKDKTGRATLEATVKGSSDELDGWLKSKAAAKKRVARRKADEKAAKEASDAEEAAEAEAKAASGSAAKSGGKKAAPSRKSPQPKTASSPKSKSGAAKTAGETKAAKTSPPKKSAASKKPAKKSATSTSDGKKSAKPKKKSASSPKSAKTSKSPRTTKGKSSSKGSGGSKTTSKSSSKKSTNRKLTKRKPR